MVYGLNKGAITRPVQSGEQEIHPHKVWFYVKLKFYTRMPLNCNWNIPDIQHVELKSGIALNTKVIQPFYKAETPWKTIPSEVFINI